MSREQILASALAKLELFFPACARPACSRAPCSRRRAPPSPSHPGWTQFRPPQTTAYPRLYVAGDWTATEWPSTMEGAVRSGRLAAGEVAGDRTLFLAPESPATGLMRWLSRQLQIR